MENIRIYEDRHCENSCVEVGPGDGRLAGRPRVIKRLKTEFRIKDKTVEIEIEYVSSTQGIVESIAELLEAEKQYGNSELEIAIRLFYEGVTSTKKIDFSELGKKIMEKIIATRPINFK